MYSGVLMANGRPRDAGIKSERGGEDTSHSNLGCSTIDKVHPFHDGLWKLEELRTVAIVPNRVETLLDLHEG